MAKKTSVSLGAALDIMNASSLKTRLETALAKDLPVVLVSDKIERADSAGLQLIYAFIKKVEQRGHTVSWQKPSDTLKQSSEILGLSKQLYLV
ncbi:STAS domain-containing protein [Aliikangiella coralliicola]|uniref:STAS domain-containing protein n=1 Tax=Aliikangiella coralliicola TaxID=2592383 RepID=A0A545UB75_9GAMM|nr:STAS domain-containing protein [Aliikangiella coralliicola]TQV86719.1 STAS domain-containing protein [Aliikangiella coralliicola]